MKPHLKLVDNFASSQEAAPLLWNPPSIQALAPKNKGAFSHVSQQKPSYGMLSLVVLAHVLGLAWLLNHKSTPPEIKELPPMIVSLVASPAPAPEIVPIVPVQTPPQPEIKKTLAKPPQVKPSPVLAQPEVPQSEVTQPVVTEAPPTPAAPVVQAKVPEAVEAPPPKVEAEAVVEPPRFGAAYLNNPAPDYPGMSRRQGEQGRVLLRVLVAADGTADTVQLEDSSGFNKLDQAAIQAVKKWTFIPAKRSNKAISAYVLVPISFSLED